MDRGRGGPPPQRLMGGANQPNPAMAQQQSRLMPKAQPVQPPRTQRVPSHGGAYPVPVPVRPRPMMQGMPSPLQPMMPPMPAQPVGMPPQQSPQVGMPMPGFQTGMQPNMGPQMPPMGAMPYQPPAMPTPQVGMPMPHQQPMPTQSPQGQGQPNVFQLMLQMAANRGRRGF